MWITPALIDVYREVRSLGFISTVGTYRDGQLVGGLWGIGIGDAFGLMSMFHREDMLARLLWRRWSTRCRTRAAGRSSISGR